MKTQITLGLISLLSSMSFAQNSLKGVETVTVSLSNRTHQLEVDLNPKTVRCLVGDYGASSLKISLSDLKHITVFRHTTRGETEPCINAGFCAKEELGMPGHSPKEILDPNKPTEKIEVNVKLEEILYLNHDRKDCSRYLAEEVTSTVRGLDFRHQDGASLGMVDYEVCLKMKEKNK